MPENSLGYVSGCTYQVAWHRGLVGTVHSSEKDREVIHDYPAVPLNDPLCRNEIIEEVSGYKSYGFSTGSSMMNCKFDCVLEQD
jgi:hypothetical protein